MSGLIALHDPHGTVFDGQTAAPAGADRRLHRDLRDCDADPAGVTDDVLMAQLLRRTMPDPAAVRLARALMDRFGDFGRAVSAPGHRLIEAGLGDDSVRDLALIRAAAQRLARRRILNRPVISSCDALLGYCRATMAHLTAEQLRVLFLDRKNILIADEILAQGTVDHVPVYPREIVKRALLLDASALILVHNHPSGDPAPSEADRAMTVQVVAAAEALGLSVHDHLVIAAAGEVSFRATGLI